MQFLQINHDLLAQGEQVFDDYSRAVLCGPYHHETYTAGKRRRGGVASLPGALIACLDSGILDPATVNVAVSRATRCRRSTVLRFMHDFIYEPLNGGLYPEDTGSALEQRLLSSTVVLAA